MHTMASEAVMADIMIYLIIGAMIGLVAGGMTIYLVTVAVRLLRGRYEHVGHYQIVENAGLYWHFVDLVWIFLFPLIYII